MVVFYHTNNTKSLHVCVLCLFIQIIVKQKNNIRTTKTLMATPSCGVAADHH